VTAAHRSPSRRDSRSWRDLSKDTIKQGMRERLTTSRDGHPHRHVTGDNRLTAATIAEEAGVDDFLAEAPPKPSSR